jgi:uncharacterized protein
MVERKHCPVMNGKQVAGLFEGADGEARAGYAGERGDTGVGVGGPVLRAAGPRAHDSVDRVTGSVMSDVRPVRVGVLIGAIVASAAALALVWGVLLRSSSLIDLALATHGLVQPTLLTSATEGLLVCGVLVVSGVSLRQLGLRWRDVPRAAALLVVLYAALQLAIVLAVLVSGDRLVPTRHDVLSAIGLFVAQLFGNTLVEETVFRGFLFRQLLARARVRGGLGRSAAATAAAAVIFALYHIPVRIHGGYRGLDLVATLVIVALGGALASYLYLRSGNLLIVVVLHTLFNDQEPLFASPIPPQWILCVLVIGVVIWIELRRPCEPPASACRAPPS